MHSQNAPITIAASGTHLRPGWPSSRWRWAVKDAVTGDLLACGIASEPSRGADGVVPLVVHDRNGPRLRVAAARIVGPYGLRLLGLAYAVPPPGIRVGQRLLVVADPADLTQVRARIERRWTALPCVGCGEGLVPQPLRGLSGGGPEPLHAAPPPPDATCHYRSPHEDFR